MRTGAGASQGAGQREDVVAVVVQVEDVVFVAVLLNMEVFLYLYYEHLFIFIKCAAYIGIGGMRIENEPCH